MGIGSILNIARNALLAQQTALQVASNNIANVNTPGYARQQTVFSEDIARSTGAGVLLGNGVSVASVMSNYNKYLENSLANESTSLQEQKTYEQYFARIESVLDENHTRLTSNITAFFNAWQDLSTDPTSITSRTNVVISGTNLTSGIRSMYSELTDMQRELDGSVYQQVTDIDNILHSIADLNGQIIALRTQGSTNSDFANQRAQLFQKLSEKMGVQSFEDSEGGLTILTSGGQMLLDKVTVFDLKAERLPGHDFYRVTWSGNGSSSIDITDSILGGGLKALLDLRDNQTPGFMGALDHLAHSLMSEVNDIHSKGITANGTGGLNFFRPASEHYALSFDLSEEVKTDPRNVALTSSASNPTNNDIALAISNLGNASVMIGGRRTTYTDYGASIASSIGTLSQNAKNLTEYHQSLMTMIQSQRDSVSGVSIDEEMSNLIKFQYAYQAAARLLNVADTMLQSILEMAR